MSYTNLEIYQLSKKVAIEIHKITIENLPRFEQNEIGKQIRRSSKSVKSNIVEGYGRREYKQDYIRFLTIALASNDETIDHLVTLFETGSFTDKEKYSDLFSNLNILGKKLNKFIQAIKKSVDSDRKNKLSNSGKRSNNEVQRAASNQRQETRCEWTGSDPLYIKYHDEEWGVPVHDDKKLFEMLLLEGAQAGLSWITILKKRENYRKAFDNFNAKKIAKFDENKREELLANAGIVRNKLKVNAFIVNAQLFLDIQKEFGSFDKYIWQFVNYKPIVNKFKSLKDVPPFTKESDAMSKDLKKRGFKFVGSTICYAFMQATGMVNDHITSCYRYRELK